MDGLQQAPATLAPDDLLALRFVRDACLSPDGRQAAVIVSRADVASDGEFFELDLIDTGTGVQTRLVGGDVRVAAPAWSPGGGKLAYLRQDADGSRICVRDLRTGTTVQEVRLAGAAQGPLRWSPDGCSIAFTVTTMEPPRPGLHRITRTIYRIEGIGFIERLTQAVHLLDVASGVTRCVSDGLGNCTQPAFSPDGARLLFLAVDGAAPPGAASSPLPYILDLASGVATPVLGEGWFVGQALWLPDGKRLLIAGAYRCTVAVPVPELFTIDLATGAFECRTPDMRGQVGLRAHEDTPVWELAFHRMAVAVDDATALATAQVGGRSVVWRVALAGPVAVEEVVGGDRTCLLLDATRDAILFLASNAHRPGDLHLLRAMSREETRLSGFNDAVLAQWPAMKLRPLSITSPDGLEFDGWFLARADVQDKLPTIMFIHGGPFITVGHCFRYDFHLLASRGWGVVFANFRGSAGYGKAFSRKIMGDWGARGFPDHMAVVDAAIAQGLADPARLGVWGASHGGLATAWIVGHTERFRAAIAEAAVTNYTTLYYLSDAGEAFTRDLGGTPVEIPDVYRSRSPLTYAHRCRTPTLLLHGAEDYRCPIAEAEQFYRALRDVGCTSEIVRIPGCNHLGDAMGPLSARVGQNEALVDWFERFL